MFIIEADHNTDAVVISPLKDALVELMRRHGVSDAQGRGSGPGLAGPQSDLLEHLHPQSLSIIGLFRLVGEENTP